MGFGSLRDRRIVVALSVVAVLGLLNVFCGGGGGGGDGTTSATTGGGTTNTATFAGTQGGTNPASQDLTARNTSTSEQAWSATASSKDAGRAVPAWLTIATSSGTVAAGGTITLTISVNTTGLAAGTYTATITLSPAGAFDPPSFTITLTVTAPTGGGTEPAPDTDLSKSVLDAPDDGLPGLVAHIMSVWGGTRSDGSFQAGDIIKVRFILKTYGTNGTNGTTLTLADMKSAEILVSGPTTHYQPVIAAQTDLLAVSVAHSSNDGSYVYTFATAIPANYIAPLNDTTSFGTGDGEWQGQPLVAGTYTVGLRVYREITVTEPDSTTAVYRDPGNSTRDFLFGGATTVEAREVVTRANCNECHGKLRIHGGTRRNTTLCLLCHLDGAEDKNVATAANGTPGISIGLANMIHRIHMGEELPSVNFVKSATFVGSGTITKPKVDAAAVVQTITVKFTNATTFDVTGSVSAPLAGQTVGAADMNYKDITYNGVSFRVQQATTPFAANDTWTFDVATGQYQVVGYQNSVHNFSTVLYPVWPDKVEHCGKCHGDSDGTGPLAAPAQGGRYATAPSRLACGSCHDNINWETGANHEGGPQPDNNSCAVCHKAGGLSDAAAAHLHPLRDPTLNAGVNFNITAVTGGTAAGGNFQAGDKIAITFTLKDDAGNNIAIADLNSRSVIAVGPTTNTHYLVPNISFAAAQVTGTNPYTLQLPMTETLSRLGTATGGADTFTAQFTPFQTGTTTTVYERTSVGGVGKGNTTLSAAVLLWGNRLSVNSVTNFAKDDYIVIERGTGNEEHSRVSWVDGAFLWTTTPMRFAHAINATVEECTLTTKTVTTHYTKNDAAGQITTVAGQFTNGNAVVITYTTDARIYATYRPPSNDTPEFGQAAGEWTGLPIIAGTYSVFVYGYKNVVVGTTTHRASSPPAYAHFLMGTATTVVPRDIVSDGGAACDKCHDRVLFHGNGRRGFDLCVTCHSLAGFGDRAQYSSPNQPTTDGAMYQFTWYLHKVHMGEDLPNSPTPYAFVTVGGRPSNPYPDNYSIATYDEIVFPGMPAKVRRCAACHGSSLAWQNPAVRNHPNQTDPTRHWTVACFSCHDDPNGRQAMTDLSPTSDSGCAVCHKVGSAIPSVDVSKVHINR